MAANPLRIAQNIARRDNHWLALLFARYIGGAKHPRGKIITAYRVARRELARVVDSPTQADEVLETLNNALLGITSSGLVEAIQHGQESAIAQADAYNADGQNIGITAAIPSFALYQSAVMGAFDAQRSILSTLIRTGAGASLIVGDKSRDLFRRWRQARQVVGRPPD